MRAFIHGIAGTCVVLAGCSAGTQPHDMSAAQHQAMAQGEEQSAAAHAAQFDPAAKFRPDRPGCGLASRAGEACWSSVSNPTAAHLDDVERHRKLAAGHRAASQTLRDAEAAACVGLSDGDRDMSPFAHREDIASVKVIGPESTLKVIPQRSGVEIVFRATPGMTAQWLQRVVDCHLARNAVLGHDAREMPYCPLVPKDVVARVTPRDAGFAVEIMSSNPATVQEIVRRAEALAVH